MKFKILFTIVTVIVLLCGAWLYSLSSGAAAQFQQLFDGFGVNPPEITRLLFASLDYWWTIMGPIVFFSYFPLYISKGNWRYVSILMSTLSLVILIGVVYVPIFNMGAVV